MRNTLSMMAIAAGLLVGLPGLASARYQAYDGELGYQIAYQAAYGVAGYAAAYPGYGLQGYSEPGAGYGWLPQPPPAAAPISWYPAGYYR